MSKQPTIRKRVVGRHRKGCVGVKQVTLQMIDCPWHGGAMRDWYNRSGTGTGSTEWVTVFCRDPQCDAELRICLDDILAAVGEAKP